MNAFTPGARRAAETREAAHRLGQPTYRGQPCAREHSGSRYVANWHCVECVAEDTAAEMACKRAQRLNTLLAAIYPEEFDRIGWHRLAAEAEV